MLNILGLGTAYPDNIITNEFLGEIGLAAAHKDFISQTGFKTRRTSLPLDYIKSTKNRNADEAIECAIESPTDLAVRAAKSALEKAGIQADKIGLIIGECSTPLETTPSEAQRIGQRLDLKVPAYDVSSGFCGPVTALDTLNLFDCAKLPDYTLVVSTHTPTQKVDYSQGIGGILFGDGAVAMVVSASKTGPVKLSKCEFFTTRPDTAPISFNTLNHATIGAGFEIDTICRRCEEILRQAIAGGLDTGRTSIVGAQFGAKVAQVLSASLNVPMQQQWSNSDRYGYTVGASELGVVAEHWTELINGQGQVATISAIGQMQGYAIFIS